MITIWFDLPSITTVPSHSMVSNSLKTIFPILFLQMILYCLQNGGTGSSWLGLPVTGKVPGVFGVFGVTGSVGVVVLVVVVGFIFLLYLFVSLDRYRADILS